MQKQKCLTLNTIFTVNEKPKSKAKLWNMATYYPHNFVATLTVGSRYSGYKDMIRISSADNLENYVEITSLCLANLLQGVEFTQ